MRKLTISWELAPNLSKIQNTHTSSSALSKGRCFQPSRQTGSHLNILSWTDTPVWFKWLNLSLVLRKTIWPLLHTYTFLSNMVNIKISVAWSFTHTGTGNWLISLSRTVPKLEHINTSSTHQSEKINLIMNIESDWSKIPYSYISSSIVIRLVDIWKVKHILILQRSYQCGIVSDLNVCFCCIVVLWNKLQNICFSIRAF